MINYIALKPFSLGSNLLSGLKHFVPVSLVTSHRAKCSFHKSHQRHCGLCAAVPDIRAQTVYITSSHFWKKKNEE